MLPKYHAAADLASTPRPKGRPRRSTESDIAIAIAYLNGESMQAIATPLGVSRERVRQILHRQGINGQASRRTGVPADPDEFRRRSTSCRILGGTWNGIHAIRRHRNTRLQHLATLRTLTATLGRTPTYGELLAVLAPTVANPHLATSMLGRFWSGGRSMKSRTIGMHRLYRLAGLRVRPLGRQPDLNAERRACSR